MGRPGRRAGARRLSTGPVRATSGPLPLTAGATAATGSTGPANRAGTTGPAQADGLVKPGRAARYGMRVLLALVGLLLAVVVVVPLTLSSQDLVRWAHSPDGLGLETGWAILVFIALDAAAAACVGMSVYCAWRGETAGMFGILVWAFAGTSAFANYRFNQGRQARDAVWFFPAMSITGPLLLEIVIRRVRRWVQTSAGRYEHPLPHFRAARWIPGIGAMRETYGAWRTAILDGRISTPEVAVARFRQLCPDGRPRVVRALRAETAQAVTAGVVQAAQAGASDKPGPAQGDTNRPALAGRPAASDQPALTDRPEPAPAGGDPSLTSPHRPAIASQPTPRRRLKPTTSGIRPIRPTRPTSPAGRAGDAEALDQLAERHSTKRPGKSAISRTLGVGGPKATRLAAVVAQLPEWPPRPQPVSGVNGKALPALTARPQPRPVEPDESDR